MWHRTFSSSRSLVTSVGRRCRGRTSITCRAPLTTTRFATTTSLQFSVSQSSLTLSSIAGFSSSATDDDYCPPPSHVLHSSLSHSLMKHWQGSAATVTPEALMYPVFVTDGVDVKHEIDSLPGQARWSVDRLQELLDPMVARGLRSVLLFGVLEDDTCKDNHGSRADHDDAPVPRALRHLSKLYPDLLLATDVCLCGYTHHGHCAVLNFTSDGDGDGDGDGAGAGAGESHQSQWSIDNQASISRLADIALAYARNGAHMIAPSDMMDGRIGAIKHRLQQHGFGGRISVMSYSAKFASCFYGPFRDAACSGMSFGDRTGYQLPPGGTGIAMRAVHRDLLEGADIIQVKPGGAYLDVIRDARVLCSRTIGGDVPIAVYQVSGEYAMLWHGAAAGAFRLDEAVMESLVSMRRAGADILITYYAGDVLKWLEK